MWNIDIAMSAELVPHIAGAPGVLTVSMGDPRPCTGDSSALARLRGLERPSAHIRPDLV